MNDAVANLQQIYYDALGKNGALGFMIVLCVIEFLIGLSLVCSPRLEISSFLTIADRGRISPSMGFLSRRRSSLLYILPPCEQTHPVPASPRHLWACVGLSDPRPVVSYQRRGDKRPLLAVRRKQLPILGHADLLPSSLGPRPFPSGRVLHWSVQQAHRIHSGWLAGFWSCVVHVSDHGAESKS